MATKTRVIVGVLGGLLATLLLAAGGLVLFIKHKNAEYASRVVKGGEMSCKDPANTDSVRDYYLQQIKDSIKGRLKDETYDQEQLDKWLAQLTIEKLSQVRTLKDSSTENQLNCEALLSVKAPRSMWDDAAKAGVMNDCAECDGDTGLDQYYRNMEVGLELPRARQTIHYNINRSDDNEISVGISNATIIDALASTVKSAILLPTRTDANRQMEQTSQNRKTLADSAMEIRLKELKAEQLKLDDRLNEIWNGGSETFKNTNRENQKTWLDKRDIECKLESDKEIYQLKDSEKEPYQVNHNDWDDSLNAKDREIRYLKCANGRTSERNDELRELVDTAAVPESAAAQ